MHLQQNSHKFLNFNLCFAKCHHTCSPLCLVMLSKHKAALKCGHFHSIIESSGFSLLINYAIYWHQTHLFPRSIASDKFRCLNRCDESFCLKLWNALKLFSVWQPSIIKFLMLQYSSPTIASISLLAHSPRHLHCDLCSCKKKKRTKGGRTPS